MMIPARRMVKPAGGGRKKRSVATLKRAAGVSPPQKKARGKKQSSAQTPATEGFAHFRGDQFQPSEKLSPEPTRNSRSEGFPPVFAEEPCWSGSRPGYQDVRQEPPSPSSFYFKAPPAAMTPATAACHRVDEWVTPLVDQSLEDAPWGTANGPYAPFTVTPPSEHGESVWASPMQLQAMADELLNEFIAVFF